jgi:hypothetical protein
MTGYPANCHSREIGNPLFNGFMIIFEIPLTGFHVPISVGTLNDVLIYVGFDVPQAAKSTVS